MSADEYSGNSGTIRYTKSKIGGVEKAGCCCCKNNLGFKEGLLMSTANGRLEIAWPGGSSQAPPDVWMGKYFPSTCMVPTHAREERSVGVVADGAFVAVVCRWCGQQFTTDRQASWL